MDYKIPPSWSPTKDQKKLIEMLAKKPGRYFPTEEIMPWVFAESISTDAPAPAKLRVLVQRSRAFLSERTDNQVSIGIKRNKGYRITKSHVRKLREMS